MYQKCGRHIFIVFHHYISKQNQQKDLLILGLKRSHVKPKEREQNYKFLYPIYTNYHLKFWPVRDSSPAFNLHYYETSI